MRLRRDAPRHGASMGPQSSSNARESELTLIRKGGYPEMRVYERGGRAERAPSRCSRRAASRRRVKYVIRGPLGLSGGRHHHPLVAAEFGEPTEVDPEI
jgi:hypothetical protein